MTGEHIDFFHQRKHSDPVPVFVLLSTFNGERFLPKLLESVANQTYPNVQVIIRDDGSSDGTLDIIQDFARRHAKFQVVLDENIGAVASFFWLLKEVGSRQGYFAFCDQDDIWLPEKIERAIEHLQSTEHPESNLYFSRFELIDGEGKLLGMSDPIRHISFNNAVVENVVTGATAVFGSRLRDLMLQANPGSMVWHDWWLYLLGAALGRVLYDEVPTMRSRRHGLNQTEMRMHSREDVVDKVKTLIRVLKRKRKVHPFQQAANFGEIYANFLSNDQRDFLEWMGCLYSGRRWQDRLKFVMSRKFELNDRLDSFGLRMLVLLGLLG